MLRRRELNHWKSCLDDSRCDLIKKIIELDSTSYRIRAFQRHSMQSDNDKSANDKN